MFCNIKQIYYLILLTQKNKISLLSQSSFVCNFVLVVVLFTLEKQRALYQKGQKNMPRKIIIRKNKVLFMNTCWHVNITTISLIYLLVIVGNYPSTWTSSISAKLEIAQLSLIKQITRTFYFSRKHTWLKQRPSLKCDIQLQLHQELRLF